MNEIASVDAVHTARAEVTTPAALLARTPLEFLQMDGPFATLGAYCKWYRRDCREGDARLCECVVDTQLSDTSAVLRVRDMGREYGDEADHAPNLRAALKQEGAWFVSARGVQANDGSETHLGGSRTQVEAERLRQKDFLNGTKPENVFQFALRHPEMKDQAHYRLTSTEYAIIICTDRGAAQYCSRPVSIDTEKPGELRTGETYNYVRGGRGLDEMLQTDTSPEGRGTEMRVPLLFTPRAK